MKYVKGHVHIKFINKTIEIISFKFGFLINKDKVIKVKDINKDIILLTNLLFLFNKGLAFVSAGDHKTIAITPNIKKIKIK